MKICYFTATGNDLYVARRVAGYVDARLQSPEVPQCELLSIPQLIREDKIELSDDAIGIVCPVYAGEMPMMVRDFINRAKLESDYIFFIYTYGSGYGEAFAHAKLALQDAGEDLAYINAVIMVDNYLPVFEMENQIETLPEKDVEGQIERICEDIAMRKRTEVVINDEVRAKMAMFENMLAKKILRKDAAKSYIVNDLCILCGTCALVCPANNITVTDKVIFHDSCEVCYACLHNCPQTAMHLESEQSSVRFRNEHISLRDIVNANR